MNNTNNKNMLLITVLMTQTAKSFRLIPATQDCPYIDVLYWDDKKVLEIICNIRKNDFTMLPKLTDAGDVEMVKGTPRAAMPGQEPKKYKEERRQTEIFQNYYITEKDEIINFVNTFAINSDTFNFKQYLDAVILEKVEAQKIITI